ncbi:hypothetical protein PENSPDRAFT_695654 [Peniophora sp. CONT]|nr:hypothetical protein PENSPDRAFT_695654 [Peniophora sp. CONT]
MAEQPTQYSTTHNTRNYNASLANTNRPLAYANEAQPPRPGKRAAPTNADSMGLASRANLQTKKKPRRTLAFKPRDNDSPAALAREARERDGLAVPAQYRTLSRIDEEPDMPELGTDDAEPVASSVQPSQINSAQPPLSNSPAPASVGVDRELHSNLYLDVDTGASAAWDGMPVPPARGGYSPPRATEALPQMRTSQGKDIAASAVSG